MAIDGFFVKHLIDELKESILNLRVLKITQTRKDMFVFHFNKKGQKFYLNFKLNSPNASTFITDELKNEDDNYNTGFITNLKRLFESSFLNNINQHLNDRVIIFEFIINDFLEGKIKRELVFEIMGRHNNLIILENNIVIDAFNKSFNDKSRSIIPKIEFQFFPTNKSLLNEINYNLIDHPLYLSRNYMGFSTLLSKYLYDHKINLFETKVNPTLDTDSKDFYWFNLFNKESVKNFTTLSQLFASIIYEPISDYRKQKNFINSELIKVRKRRANLETDLFEANKNIELKNIGNLIYASGKNLNEKYAHIYDFNNNLIELDSKYTLGENAKKAFTKYQKSVRAIKFITENIEKTNDLEQQLLDLEFFLSLENPNINEINEELISLGYKIKQKRINKNKKDSIELLTYNYLDTTIYVGKNNKQNDYITHKLSHRNDYWLHVEGASGSHVLVKSDNLSDELLYFSAMLAAKYSKLNNLVKIPINYTQIKNLKKIPGKHGSMVSINNYKTIVVTIDDSLINSVVIAKKLK